MLSVHKLLARATGRESLLSNLNIPQLEKSQLVDARTEIRAALRLGFSAASKELTDNGTSVVPKFFTQGSHAYETMNEPSKYPQQVDMDDGCYLPITFVKETGKPKQAAMLFFKAADDSLRALCEKKGWKYIDHNEHCCRIEISKKAHVDVPLYAIDETRFALLKFAEAKGLPVNAERADDTEDSSWARVPEGEVLHATRSGNWQYSDPMAVRDWAIGAVEMSGEQLRSIWRYLKTWRDLHYATGGPSSILLMAIAEQGFGEQSDRDDVKLRDVADYLSTTILRDVNPEWDKDENLNRLNSADRIAASRHAKELVATLNDCFAAAPTTKAAVVRSLQSRLSVHIPDKPDAIEEVAPFAVAFAAAPSRSESAPWAPNTKSG